MSLPTIELVEDGFYWVRERGDARWIVARNSCGYFYPTGCDYSVTPAAISGPIPSPAPETPSPAVDGAASRLAAQAVQRSSGTGPGTENLNTQEIAPNE